MKRVHSPHFEPLEGRQLLSGAHAAHAAREKARPAAAAATPLVFSGTLTVDNKKAMTNTNQEYGYTSYVPVSGQLSGIGAVHGIWYESTDETGDLAGPDTINLHSAKGAFTIAFSNADPGPAHKDGSTVYYQHDQKFGGGTGSFAHDTETGTIDLNENAAQTEVVSVTLNGS